MKNKLRLIISCLLICALVPMNYAFAGISIDRDSDGINIDDIVYHLAQPGSLSNSEYIRNLMYQIAPINSLPTAAEVTAGITSVTTPAADATVLTLPSVPNGYTIALQYSSKPEVIGTNGVIVPPGSTTSVDLVFTLTRSSDNSTANTGTITVTVPALTPLPTPSSGINVALASNGGIASASSTINSSFTVSSINNGDKRGLNWGNGGGWNDGTVNTYPDWVQIDFNGSQTIHGIDVFTIQDNYGSPSEPTNVMTFSQYGIINFIVQYWDASTWVTVTNGSVTGNNNVWRQFNFLPVTTNKIRVTITNAQSSYSRVIEVEAWIDQVVN